MTKTVDATAAGVMDEARIGTEGRSDPGLLLERSADRLRLALVSWTGEVGGAEVATFELARQWRLLGVEPTVIIVVRGGRELASRLETEGIPYRHLGHGRGSHALLRPFRLARMVAEAGPDGVLLADCTYLSALLRLGGYRGGIVGVEHGWLLGLSGRSRLRALGGRIVHGVGARTRDVDVAVSDFMLDELRRHPHARRVCRIHNGVDTSRYAPAGRGVDAGTEPAAFVVGCACRLIPGKGTDQAIRAVAMLAPRHDVLLRVAGDGPERRHLERLAEELGVRDRVEFCGLVHDMPEFWAGCDLVVSASDTLIESFSMVTLEAMACGRPVVGTRNGGIPEVIGDAGLVVPPGDPVALADAIGRYASDRGLASADGARARARAEDAFGARQLALEYLALVTRTQAEPVGADRP